MPRLKDARTGVVVSVSDETAARLGRGWVPADAAADPVVEPETEESETAEVTEPQTDGSAEEPEPESAKVDAEAEVEASTPKRSRYRNTK